MPPYRLIYLIYSNYSTNMFDKIVTFHMSYAWFGAINYAITGLLLGWVVWRIPRSIEWYRRAYLLRKKKKVKIGGPDFFIFRALGISTSPWAICLGLLCYVIFGCVDLMVQNSTGTRMVSISRKGVVTKRAIAPYTKDGWSKELPAYERHFYPCSVYYKEGVAVWPTT